MNNVEVFKNIPVDRFIEKIVPEIHIVNNAVEVVRHVDKIIEVPKLITV